MKYFDHDLRDRMGLVLPLVLAATAAGLSGQPALSLELARMTAGAFGLSLFLTVLAGRGGPCDPLRHALGACLLFAAALDLLPLLAHSAAPSQAGMAGIPAPIEALARVLLSAGLAGAIWLGPSRPRPLRVLGASILATTLLALAVLWAARFPGSASLGLDHALLTRAGGYAAAGLCALAALSLLLARRNPELGATPALYGFLILMGASQLCFAATPDGSGTPALTGHLLTVTGYAFAYWWLARVQGGRHNGTEEIEALNRSLENRIREATEESRKKDLLLMEQSRLASMGEMIGSIAHQWRQPLNAVSLLVANLALDAKSGDQDTGQFDAYAKQCHGILTSMSHTIDDFRNFFKPDKGKCHFLLRDPVEETLNLVRASLSHHGIALEADLDGAACVLGFRGEYSQVILNLLVNAKDAIVDSGRRKGLIRITTASRDGYAEVAVHDDGGGVREEVMGRVFEPYFTTKGRDKGTGIGLYMAKHIIEDHMHGRISLYNSDVGAVFTVSLPAASSELCRKEGALCR